MIYDFHEHTLEQAMNKTHDAIGMVRAKGLVGGRSIEAEFIVGHGIIRNELMKVLQGYGLSPSIKLGNSGVIICTIE